MDLTPHLVTGAAIGTRVRHRGLAVLLALVSEPLLDAVPHFHVGWINGKTLAAFADTGLGLVLVGVIVLRGKSLWPLATAITAVLPNLPVINWNLVFGFLPHPQWAPPWGIATQVLVTTLAFLWSMKQLPTIGPSSRAFAKDRLAR